MSLYIYELFITHCTGESNDSDNIVDDVISHHNSTASTITVDPNTVITTDVGRCTG